MKQLDFFEIFPIGEILLQWKRISAPAPTNSIITIMTTSITHRNGSFGGPNPYVYRLSLSDLDRRLCLSSGR